MHAKQRTSSVVQEKFIADEFISAFEAVFCSPSPMLNSLILARKPPLALLFKVKTNMSASRFFIPDFASG